ncbi:MAG: hypothetical protein ACXACP_06395 [Candidatus Hodarchaeales archaeon]
MLKIKDLNSDHILLAILGSDFSEKQKENMVHLTEELLDLLSKYKSKRNLLEGKLKHYNDPRQYEFYVYLANLALLDVVINDLEYLNQLLCDG